MKKLLVPLVAFAGGFVIGAFIDECFESTDEPPEDRYGSPYRDPSAF